MCCQNKVNIIIVFKCSHGFNGTHWLTIVLIFNFIISIIYVITCRINRSDGCVLLKAIDASREIFRHLPVIDDIYASFLHAVTPVQQVLVTIQCGAMFETSCPRKDTCYRVCACRLTLSNQVKFNIYFHTKQLLQWLIVQLGTKKQ